MNLNKTAKNQHVLGELSFYHSNPLGNSSLFACRFLQAVTTKMLYEAYFKMVITCT